MSIYKFRVLIEGEDTVFRDVEIQSDQNFETFHQIILKAFEFDNSQMASFYLSDDDWNKGQEIALFDMSIPENEGEKVLEMEKTPINSITNKVGEHLLYTYDFLNMWNFFIELIEVDIKETGDSYPKVVHSEGKAPIQSSRNELITDEDIANDLLKADCLDDDEMENDFNDDIFEGFDDFEDYQ
ncbi:MAG: hypothetical protein J5I47_09280 [Vicingus serpentipes]|nr:hypothetical protein [Vicingus serpentipes]